MVMSNYPSHALKVIWSIDLGSFVNPRPKSGSQDMGSHITILTALWSDPWITAELVTNTKAKKCLYNWGQLLTMVMAFSFGLPPSNLTISILLTLYMLIVHSRKRKGVESIIFKIPSEQLKPFVHPKYLNDMGFNDLEDSFQDP
jgi:hypothetical protein